MPVQRVICLQQASQAVYLGSQSDIFFRQAFLLILGISIKQIIVLLVYDH